MTKLTGLVALVLLSVAPLSADIAPSQYIANGIVPKSKTPVRMEKANVEIVWSTPCSLIATFTMVNPTAVSQETQIGFPMPPTVSFRNPDAKPDSVSISFDNIEAAVVAPAEKPGYESTLVWYHCTYAFRPGTTIVTVKASLRASIGHSAFQESLFYCIETGGRWAGTIGEETVTIRFPYPIEENQITSAAPAGSKVDGDSVRWHLLDVEPRGKEFDINLTYVRPDAMHVLANIRRDLSHDPSSAALTIKLARNLFALGVPKSNSGFPPDSLSKEEYSAILTRITTERHRQIFTQYYDIVRVDAYRTSNTEWTDERREMIQILADAGYRDEESKSVFILEAERLIGDVLKREPHNAEAWNVYLANYWRISFAAVGHWFGSTRLSAAQLKAIETAAKNCPNDEYIQGWLSLTKTDGREIGALKEKLNGKDYRRVDLPIPQYDYY